MRRGVFAGAALSSRLGSGEAYAGTSTPNMVVWVTGFHCVCTLLVTWVTSLPDDDV
jgi:hypothetical protein